MKRSPSFRLLDAIALGTVLTACCAAAAGADPAVADPVTIYDAARRAWAYTSYPRYANYTVRVSYRNGETAVTRRYDTLQDLRRGIVFAHAFSREEAANPSFPPHGVNIGLLGATLNRAQPDDPIGPLALAVTYDFGISPAPLPTHVAQTGSDVTAPAQLQVIGRSGTPERTYAVRLIEMLDGGATYHLGLTPLRDPKRFRLREMWIDTQTYITRKILISANFARAPYTGVPWLITFRQIDGGPYIAKEQAQGALDFGDAGALDGVTVEFEDLTRTSSLPAYGTVGINGGSTEFVTEP